MADLCNCQQIFLSLSFTSRYIPTTLLHYVVNIAIRLCCRFQEESGPYVLSFSMTSLPSLAPLFSFSFWFYGTALLILFNSWRKTIWRHSSIAEPRPALLLSLLSPQWVAVIKAQRSKSNRFWNGVVQLPARMAAKTSSKIKARQIQSLQWDWPLLYKQPSGRKEAPGGALCDGAGEWQDSWGPGGDGTPKRPVDRGQAGCSKVIISKLFSTGPVTSEQILTLRSIQVFPLPHNTLLLPF